jgi:serine/threonine-protein kinase RsbW
MEKTFNIKSNIKEIAPVVKEMLDCLKKGGASNEIIHDVKLSAEEAMINAMKHGNKCREDLPVMINFEYSKDKITVSVQDKGSGYDYNKIPDPTLDENIAKGHGRGVFLIRRLMDEVRFNNSGNCIYMVKYIK